ncbi:DUF6879 family protein [Streptosporangium subroseum]|uniref:DUF6879 family protein n=1 Tax=Streptosporangium subroseum TaxID=106412 RepID=UPI003084E474|nr:hypothetical protein OHB15_38965 [Streptosporangium subroseum]
MSGDDFVSLFSSFTDSAFRLETRERYHLAKDEEEPLRRFLAGESDDMSWMDGWFDLMRDHKAHGRSVSRVRVVSRPFSDYTRFSMSIARRSITAGDQIHYLDRVEAERLDLPRTDWWLFDDERLALLHLDAHDVLLGAEISIDPRVIEEHQKWREIAWRHAVSLKEFVKPGA